MLRIRLPHSADINKNTTGPWGPKWTDIDRISDDSNGKFEIPEYAYKHKVSSAIF